MQRIQILRESSLIPETASYPIPTAVHLSYWQVEEVTSK